MPNPISHHTPALLLKMRFPKLFNASAICIGAMLPDLTFWLGLRARTHSLLGQVYWTLPLALLFTILFNRYIAGILSNYAGKNGFFPKLLRYFGVDDWGIIKRDKLNIKFFLVASYSAIIGGISHLLLDLPSHPHTMIFYPWVTIRIHEVVWISGVVWVVEDIFFFVTTLYLFRMIKKKELIKKWDEVWK
ncbi:MAG: DUF4184 family protein [Promethearchaeota archaeon]|jgi:hypothetical protein